MNRSRVIVTDSGGVQEEAPALGKPVLVTREATERREGVTSGLIRTVGTSKRSIVLHLREHLLRENLASAHKREDTPASPYGDGRAGEKIVDAIRKLHRPNETARRAFVAAGSLVEQVG
jgi:UDP-N-acetylglucosamine 2-epimerase